jgi:hypothetical protein
MKNLLLFSIGIILLTLFNSTCFAVSLDSFVIESQYLSNGNVQVNASPQTIQVDISLSRNLLPTRGVIQLYEPVNWTVTILLKDGYTDNQIVISTPLTITSDDFNGTAFCSKNIAVLVPANQYTSYTASGFVYNSTVFLEYSSNNGDGNLGYSVNTYPVTLNDANSPLTASGPVVQNPSVDGIPLSPASVWNGQVYNPVYAGYPVPINIAQFYYTLPGVPSGYGFLDWIKAQTTKPFNNEPGTIINFNDSAPILTQGQAIYSPNNLYRLTLQTDGNLVLYDNTTNVGIWNSETQGKSALSFYFQSDLHLVLRNGLLYTSPSVWASSFHTTNGSVTQYAHLNKVMAYPYLKLQDDGNLVFHWPNGVESTSGGPATPVIIILEASSGGSGDLRTPVQYSQSADGNSGSALANYFEITH